MVVYNDADGFEKLYFEGTSSDLDYYIRLGKLYAGWGVDMAVSLEERLDILRGSVEDAEEELVHLKRCLRKHSVRVLLTEVKQILARPIEDFEKLSGLLFGTIFEKLSIAQEKLGFSKIESL